MSSYSLSRGTDRAQILARRLDGLWISVLITLETALNHLILATSTSTLATGQCLRDVKFPAAETIASLITHGDSTHKSRSVSVMNITPPILCCLAPSPTVNLEIFGLLSTAPGIRHSGQNPSMELLDGRRT